jgi:hypothetical protein
MLSDRGLRVNAGKITYCTDGIEYLEYWVSNSGIHPINKKIEAIKHMVCPTTIKEFRWFIGLVMFGYAIVSCLYRQPI